MGFNAERDVFRPNQTVVALGKLLFQHLRIFHAYIIELVMLRLNLNDLVVFAHITFMVNERKLKADAGIKVVEEVTPAFKNGVLIFVLRELIVDVIEADGFGIQMFLHPADAVPSHFQIRNRPLHGQVMLFLLFCFCLCRRLEEFLEDAAEQRLLILFFSQ